MYIIDVYVIMYNSQKKIHTCSAGVSVYRESRVLSAYAWLSVLMARTERFGGLGLLPIGATTPWPGPRHCGDRWLSRRTIPHAHFATRIFAGT